MSDQWESKPFADAIGADAYSATATGLSQKIKTQMGKYDLFN